MGQSNKVTVLYDLEDRMHWQNLKKSLELLTMLRQISVFDMHEDVVFGDKEETIKQELRESELILCLVSPVFLKNHYTMINELVEEGWKNRIIPIKLKPTSLYEHTSIASLKTYPDHYDAILSAPAPIQEQIFTEIVNNVFELITE